MQLRFEQHLPIDRESLFRFHETPDNLQMLMEKWTAFRILDHEGTIRTGAKMRVAERLGPFWIPMTFEHFAYEPPLRFGERQIKGPFAICEHIHEFVEDGSGTKIVDLLNVALPFWLGGSVATRLCVAPRLRRMFAFRQQAYASLHKSGQIASLKS
jgi:ligand-binding SRPBCC domain-containing protein